MDKEKYFASIDLGTDLCRLLIVNEAGECICRETISTKLGEGLQLDSNLTQKAIKKGVDSFEFFKNKLEEYGVKDYRAIATYACRTALNSHDFIQKVRNVSGINIEIIHSYEEAKLNLKGAMLNADSNKKYVVVIDVGGGSTEITFTTNAHSPKIIHTVSIPWGMQNASDKFDLTEYKQDNAKKLKQEVKSYIDEFMLKSKLAEYIDDTCFIATSSTALRLAAMSKGFDSYNNPELDGLKISVGELDRIIENTQELTNEQLLQNSLIGKDWSKLTNATFIIFKTVYNGLQAKELIISQKNTNDGIIQDLIKKKKNYVASIDLGTGLCGLMIANEKGECVYRNSILTKLGEGMGVQLNLTDAAITRTINCLKNFKDKLDEYSIKNYRAISTSVCRKALNTADFLQAAKDVSGIEIDVIYGYEEARLNLKGACLNADKNKKYVVVFDLGAGSVELIFAKNGSNPEIIHSISIPKGFTENSRIFDLMEYNLENTKSLKEEIKPYIDNFMSKSNLAEYLDDTCFIITSSTALRLAAMSKNIDNYNNSELDGTVLSVERLNEVIEYMHLLTKEQRIQNPLIGLNWEHFANTAFAMMKIVYDGLQAKELIISQKNANDGMILELIESNK